jgi:hypothetical protein
MPIYLFIKKAIEKRSYYSDTPGKFALLKELKRNFLQIFVVDSSCFCNFVGSSSNLVVISFLFQLSSSFLILLKVVDMFAF